MQTGIASAFEHSFGRVAFHSFGKGNAPILFLHGIGHSGAALEDVGPMLDNPRLKLIVPDLLGCGGSSASPRFSHTAVEHAQVFLDFIEQANLADVVVVGHSYGGGIALFMALNENHPAARRIRALILIDSMCYPQPLPFFITLLRMPVLGPLSLRLIPPWVRVRLHLPGFFFDQSVLTERLRRRYMESMSSPGCKRHLVQSARNIIPPDYGSIGEKYAGIHIPVLILWGDHDRIIPLSNGIRLSKDIPNARLHVLPRCGHVPPEEQPKQVASHIADFLREVV